MSEAGSAAPAASRAVRWTADAAAVIAVALVAWLLIDRAQYEPELGYDESAAALALSLREGHFGNRVDPVGPTFSRHFAMDAYPPVYYAVSAVAFEAAGFGLVQARAVSALFVAATGLLCYLLGRWGAGPAGGLLALGLYLYVPLRVYTVVARPDVAVPFFLMALALVFAWWHERRPAAMAYAVGALLALALLSHFAALMAAPLIVGYVIASQGRGARLATAARLAAGAMVPGAVNLWLMSPHLFATVQHFFNYREIGLAVGSTPPWRSAWPIRPFMQHLDVLRQYHPPIAWASVAVLLTAVVTAITGARRVRLLAWSAVLLFLAFGCYPNIAIYGYYGPMYLCFMAAALGAAAAAVLPRRGAGGAFGLAAGVALCAWMIIGLAGNANAARLYDRGVRVDAPRAWSEQFAAELSAPVVMAGPHWVYSAAERRVRSPRVLASVNGRATVLPAYARRNLEFPEAGELRSAIADRYSEINNVQAVLLWNALVQDAPHPPVDELIRRAGLNVGAPPAGAVADQYRHLYMGFLDLLRSGFRLEGLVLDATRLSSNAAVLVRTAGARGADTWPRIAVTARGGVEARHIDEACTVSSSGRLDLHRSAALWTRELALRGAPALEGKLLIARLELADDLHDVAAPYVFVAFHPSAGEAAAAARAFAEARVPPMAIDASLGIANFILPAGGWGRDLMMTIRTGGDDAGVFAIYATAPVAIARVVVAAASAAGEGCDHETRAALARLLPVS